MIEATVYEEEGKQQSAETPEPLFIRPQRLEQVTVEPRPPSLIKQPSTSMSSPKISSQPGGSGLVTCSFVIVTPINHRLQAFLQMGRQGPAADPKQDHPVWAAAGGFHLPGRQAERSRPRNPVVEEAAACPALDSWQEVAAAGHDHEEAADREMECWGRVGVEFCASCSSPIESCASSGGRAAQKARSVCELPAGLAVRPACRRSE
jgi:hypothetical protein